jgi:hypothetical protein
MDKPIHLEPAPESTAFDHALTAAKVGAVALPFLGSGIALFELITTPLRGKRLSDWCEEVRLGLNELSETVAGLTPEKLAASEEFNSAFIQAAQAAMKTHEKDKLDALRNAVLNVASGTANRDESQVTAFLALVDRFVSAHLQILHKFQSPPAAGHYDRWSITIQNPGTPTRWIKEFIPSLKLEDTNFIRMLVTDLYNAGLTPISPDAQTIPRDNQMITAFGSGFLNFISEPTK